MRFSNESLLDDYKLGLISLEEAKRRVMDECRHMSVIVKQDSNGRWYNWCTECHQEVEDDEDD